MTEMWEEPWNHWRWWVGVVCAALIIYMVTYFCWHEKDRICGRRRGARIPPGVLALICLSIPHIPTQATLPGQAESQCMECIQSTRTGHRITQTLMYYNVAPDCIQQLDPCVHNKTQYYRCIVEGNKTECYEPLAVGPVTSSIYVYGYKGGTANRAGERTNMFQIAQNRQGYIAHNTTRGAGKVMVCFDACLAINKGQGPNGNAGIGCGNHGWERSYLQDRKYLFKHIKGGNVGAGSGTYNYWYTEGVKMQLSYKGPEGINLTQGAASTDCSAGHCNPVCLWAKEMPSTKPKIIHVGLGIDGTGKDPYGYLVIQIHTTKVTKKPITVFEDFEEEIQHLNALPLPPKAHNMFLSLAETIAKELTVKNCFVCGGTNMGDQWPWVAHEVNYTEIYLSQNNYTYNHPGKEIWQISNNVVGMECFVRNVTSRSNGTQVGNLPCMGQWEGKNWWGHNNKTWPTPLGKIRQMGFLLDPENRTLEWTTPLGFYWACGEYAYNRLPPDWVGSCVLATLRPSFFLLPLHTKARLGVPVYDEIGPRRRRAIQIGNWLDTEWPPERIIQYYGPATWANDGTAGSFGRDPIYLLNRIIRLQAVVEIITNDTAAALTKLAKESAKSRTYIMQNRLALDYLLAKEGGVCGKFNLTNCCIEIDDSGKVVKDIADRMVKLAHVPVQTWDGFNFKDMFSTWFPKLPGLQAIVALIGLIAAGCVLIPCILPIFVRAINNSLALLAERKVHTHLMTMRYTAVPTREDEDNQSGVGHELLCEFETRYKKRGDCEKD
ncbi:endogenous retrovirus group 3 member 1 Env polyprotein [Zootoca vivipara]|uniref:endogenous retrovirus group 3 member 1 Env polyprotein n=1 Tax=Zootoca vivipara TaxID=8524 RepID=UPI00293BF684|nr:endogenous retrovirus group 3 member 1 Env polyprotein [Zootoca vivipara]